MSRRLSTYDSACAGAWIFGVKDLRLWPKLIARWMLYRTRDVENWCPDDSPSKSDK